MDITPYVDRLQASLTGAAAPGTPEVRDAADRLAAALEPAARLGFMEALSDAAGELSRQLNDTTVRVVLDGRDLDFVVEYDDALAALAEEEPAAPAAERPSTEDEDDSVARLTLRLPESVKTRAEELAADAGISLNSWVVTALRSATSADGIQVDLPGFGRGRRGERGRWGGGRPDTQRETGWV